MTAPARHSDSVGIDSHRDSDGTITFEHVPLVEPDIYFDEAPEFRDHVPQWDRWDLERLIPDPFSRDCLLAVVTRELSLAAVGFAHGKGRAAASKRARQMADKFKLPMIRERSRERCRDAANQVWRKKKAALLTESGEAPGKATSETRGMSTDRLAAALEVLPSETFAKGEA